MPASTCVYCRLHPADSRWHPFCSERCRLADLGRWLQGDYRVPGAPVDPTGPLSDDEEEPEGPF